MTLSFKPYLHPVGFKGDNLGSIPLLIQMEEGDAGLVELPFGLLKLVRFTLSETLLYQFTQLLELLICTSCEHIMNITNKTVFFCISHMLSFLISQRDGDS